MMLPAASVVATMIVEARFGRICTARIRAVAGALGARREDEGLLPQLQRLRPDQARDTVSTRPAKRCTIMRIAPAIGDAATSEAMPSFGGIDRRQHDQQRQQR